MCRRSRRARTRSSPRFPAAGRCWRWATATILLRRHRRAREGRSRTPQFSSRAADANRVVTGGDDGRIVEINRRRRGQRARRRGRQVDRRPRVARGWRRRLVRRQAGARARRQGRGAKLGRAIERARHGLHAQGLPARLLALQRREPLVPQSRRDAGRAQMARLASRSSPCRRTEISASPRCRRMRCTAGASPTRRTCA